MPLAQLSASFQSLPLLPTSKLGPSGADFWVGGFVYVLGPCGSLQGTLLCGWEFLSPLQPPQVFSVRGFDALLSSAGTLSFLFCLAAQLFFLVYLQASVGPPAPPATALPDLVLQPLPCCKSSPPWLPVSAPPTGLGECFFLNSLVVRLPYTSVFWQY